MAIGRYFAHVVSMLSFLFRDFQCTSSGLGFLGYGLFLFLFDAACAVVVCHKLVHGIDGAYAAHAAFLCGDVLASFEAGKAVGYVIILFA